MLRPVRCESRRVLRRFKYTSAQQQNAALLDSRWFIGKVPAIGLRFFHAAFAPLDVFKPRHLGPRKDEVQSMLDKIGFKTLDEFIDHAVPASIRLPKQYLSDKDLVPLSETELSTQFGAKARMNKSYASFIGLGYYQAKTPAVIQRNILENPAWYTSYTPYQPEIAQGRLESLINYQTVCTSLTGLDLSNASLLDEGTSAAEAMGMCFAQGKNKRKTFLVDSSVYEHTYAVLQTRAAPLGITLIRGDITSILNEKADSLKSSLMGVLVQYPAQDGRVTDWSALASKVHDLGGLVTCATDLLSLCLLKPPGEWGADIAFGNSARFGVPLGYGGPHAAFFSCKDGLKRKLPGRLIGLSKDVDGHPAYRLALQTREQHIRRDKATSNVCTAQALLANMAANYAVYHGPEGLLRIAHKVHATAGVIKLALAKLGLSPVNDTYFDTLIYKLSQDQVAMIHQLAEANQINLRAVDDTHVGISVDEMITSRDVTRLINVFKGVTKERNAAPVSQKNLFALAKEHKLTSFVTADAETLFTQDIDGVPSTLRRTSKYLQQPVFNSHKSETEMMRYLHSLQAKDLSLVHALTPLGSCSMKLNSASSMFGLSMPGFSKIHPFAPTDQAEGYKALVSELSADLARITGLPGVSLQPNSGAQGEYTGLSVIRAYHLSRGDEKRNICLIPVSAHGTNPASAIMCGMQVVSIKTRPNGNLDLEDLKAKAEQYKDRLAAFMVTYPSTFGVFEPGIKEANEIIHANGGQVYMDGANMSAQLGLTNPGTCGADVCHLNLHKTFGIPHGGGGPGVGPICVASHLEQFLPGHPIVKTGGENAITPVTSAPFGSASVLTISWAFCRLLGGSGLTDSASFALLNANYMMARLKDHYQVKFTNEHGLCAHEFLIDLAEFEKVGIKVTDVAKRLQDFSFHPPTCSWPISTAMLIEPTECESLQELDRFCDAMITIRQEIQDIVDGKQPKEGNVLKNAPHPVRLLVQDNWDRPYSRSQAVYPDARLRQKKFWPSVGRLQESYGDLNLICECASVEEVAIE